MFADQSRYFIFFYVGLSSVTQSAGWISVTTTKGEFPSKTYLREEASRQCGMGGLNISLTGWEEMTKKDYISFMELNDH
jgi:hypothetical protein